MLSGKLDNYEKIAGVTGNDPLTSIAQTFENGDINKKKSKQC